MTMEISLDALRDTLAQHTTELNQASQQLATLDQQRARLQQTVLMLQGACGALQALIQRMNGVEPDAGT